MGREGSGRKGAKWGVDMCFRAGRFLGRRRGSGSVGQLWWCIRYRRCGWRGGMEQLREGGVEQVGYGMGTERFSKSKLQGKFVERAKERG